MSAIPSREVTSTQVGGITFGFYSDDEVNLSPSCMITVFRTVSCTNLQDYSAVAPHALPHRHAFHIVIWEAI